MFLTKYPEAIGGYRFAPGWDVRTWGQGTPPSCSAIIARGYQRQTQFPAWIMNIPFGQDRRIDNGELDALAVENPRPPEAEYAMLVQGAMEAPATGNFSVVIGSDVRLSGDLDGTPIPIVVGNRFDTELGPGPHSVNLRVDLTGRNWRFIPLWNGGDVFSSVATATAPLTGTLRSVQRLARWVTPAIVASLLGSWVFLAIRTLRPGVPLIAAIVATSAAAAWAGHGGPESSLARLGVLVLVACIAIRVPRHLHDGRGAWLLMAAPWLALLTAIVFRSIGGFQLYFFGDDTLTYQRFAYRIFMEGYWLEGGQQTFWNQPLYRWICGGLHVLFGDSSAGEWLWDGFALLTGAMFAFHVTKRIGGFRFGIAAAAGVLVTVVLGPNWYMIGRGLSEISAAMWICLAALALLRAREGAIRHAMLAGGFAALAFYTRLNHLPLVFALAALLLPDGVVAGAAFEGSSWRRLASSTTAAYVLILVAGLGLFAARTWFYTGHLDVFSGTTRLHNATGLGLSLDSLWSVRAWRNALESVLMIITVQDPPRFDIRAILVIAGFGVSLLGLARAPIARRLPLGICVACLGCVAGGLVARGAAYPGRFSLHLIPVAVAVSVSMASLALSALQANREPTEVLADA
jgi:hypothetical protein